MKYVSIFEKIFFRWYFLTVKWISVRNSCRLKPFVKKFSAFFPNFLTVHRAYIKKKKRNWGKMRGMTGRVLPYMSKISMKGRMSVNDFVTKQYSGAHKYSNMY